MSLPWDATSATTPQADLSFEPQIGSEPEDNVDETWVEELKESTPWFTKGFWAASAVRAVRTFAQTLVATITAAGVGIFVMEWYDSLLTSAGAALLSFLMSVDRNVRS
jgi:hypothetical protein